MKTVLIPIHDGTITKNLLRTDFLGTLVATQDVRVILLLNSADAQIYRKEFGIEGKVIVEDAKVYKKADPIELLFSSLFKHSIPTTFMKIRQADWYWNKGKYFLYYGSSLLRILGRFRVWRRFLSFVNILEPIDPKVRAVYEKWSPDMVFAPTMLSRVEVALMRLAHRDKKVVVGMAKSFDNLTSKAYLRIKPDLLIVPNEVCRREAVTLYDYPQEKVRVTGISQYDAYIGKNIIEDREAFFKKVALDPLKKTILYAPAGDWMNPTDHEVLRKILHWTTDGTLKDTQVLLRLHPTYESQTQELEGHTNLHVERPGSHYGDLKHYEFEAADVRHLASSLAHADLVINTASTLMVESCIFDTPVIALGFDGDTKKDYWYSVVRYYDREHLLPVTKTGGVPIVRSFEELLSQTKAYFTDPTLHTRERVEAVRVVCGDIDGAAAVRTAHAALEALRSFP
jgi:hypothetical protein